MKFKQRLIIFAFGALMGAVMVSIIKAKRAREHEAPDPAIEAPMTDTEIQREAVPGILQAYAERLVPMESDFIKATKLYEHPAERTYCRVLILEGELPEQLLRIEETIVKKPRGPMVDSVRVMAADKLVVTLEPGSASNELADAIRPFGYRIRERADAPDAYIVTLGAKAPETVPDAMEQVSVVENVVSAQPLYLDEVIVSE